MSDCFYGFLVHAHDNNDSFCVFALLLRCFVLHWYTEITRTHHFVREIKPSRSGLQRPWSAPVTEGMSAGGGLLHPRTLKARSSWLLENSSWKSPSEHPVRHLPTSWTRGVAWCGCNANLASNATRKMMHYLIRPPPPRTQCRPVMMLCAARWGSYTPSSLHCGRY